MDVARDRVGTEALLQRRLADRVVEATAAVPDVDETPRCLAARAAGRTPALHVLFPARCSVGEHVAGPQQVEEVGEIAGRRADVAHHAELLARHLGRADRAPQRLETVAAYHRIGDAHLDTQREVGVLGHHLGAGLHVGVVDVEHLARGEPARQPNGGDVHEAEQARARLGDDPMAEVAEGIRARVARRHRGGGGGDRHQLVGGQPDAQVRTEVRVEVDQPRRHQLAAASMRCTARRAGYSPPPPRSGRTDADVALARSSAPYRARRVAITLVLRPDHG